MRPYLLLTPGPLTTTDTVKEAMMSDWCTWDEDYNIGIVEGILPANTAVVVRAEASSDPYYIHETDQKSDAVSGNVLVGSLVDIPVPADGALVLSVSERNGIGFYNYTGSMLGANKAYIPKSLLNYGVKSLTMEYPGGETTGISVSSPFYEGNCRSVYNINGQRVVNITSPGVYIVKGKKVVVK